MRITYRRKNNRDYWNDRWENIPADVPMENTDAYPLKYSEILLKNWKNGPILEAGCGNGRILRFYNDKGFDIIGFDFIEVAVKKLQKVDPNLKVDVGNITKLKYADGSFKYVLAFGLYHNLENGLQDALKETHRVLEHNGFVCASFRADNIQNRFTDWLSNEKSDNSNLNNSKVFHKMNLTRKEFSSLFKDHGFEIESIYPVENMPILYKFSIFRAHSHKDFDENIARSEGYRLSGLGQILQNMLMKFFPNQFCNIYVIIAKKNKS